MQTCRNGLSQIEYVVQRLSVTPDVSAGAASRWVGADYKALPSGSWPTASGLHLSPNPPPP